MHNIHICMANTEMKGYDPKLYIYNIIFAHLINLDSHKKYKKLRLDGRAVKGACRQLWMHVVHIVAG